MKSKLFNILSILLVGLMLNSCYTHRAIGLLQDRKKLPHYEQAEYEHYKLQVNDEIIYRLITMDETISRVMQESSASSANGSSVASYRIYSDGTIDIPFLPPIYVVGLTIEEAQEKVQAEFRKVIPDADVKLTILNKTFTIIGDINSGTYEIYKDKMTIYQALAMSGDLSQPGDRKHVRIIRPREQQEPEVLEFDIRTNTLIGSKYYYIYPNDVIYVARDKGSFFKVASYSAFIGLITSSLSLLVSVINYTTLVP